MNDRRKKRSHDPLVALHYQLAHAKEGGALDAIVLSDSDGLVVAGAGAWVVCEELAAYAPIFARLDASGKRRDDRSGPALPSRLSALKDEVEVQTVEWEGQSLLLCALATRSGAFGGRDRADPRPAYATAHAVQGITRILGTSP